MCSEDWVCGPRSWCVALGKCLLTDETRAPRLLLAPVVSTLACALATEDNLRSRGGGGWSQREAQSFQTAGTEHGRHPNSCRVMEQTCNYNMRSSSLE